MIAAPLALVSVTFTVLEAQGDFTTSNQVQYLSPLITWLFWLCSHWQIS